MHLPAGFTLVEMMITVAIMAVILTLGVPAFNDFVADQRVRTAASDLIGEIAYARAEAVKNSRRVMFLRTGAGWQNGWRISLCTDTGNPCTEGQTLKISNGLSGRLRMCSNVGEFATAIIFRPDGRIVRATPATANDGITISDTLGDGNPANDKIRSVLFGVSGRATLVAQNGRTNGGAPCP